MQPAPLAPCGAAPAPSRRASPRAPLSLALTLALLCGPAGAPALASSAAPRAQAQPAAPAPAPASTGSLGDAHDSSPEQLARDLRRVLQLADGRCLRGRARLAAQGWELRREGAWIALEGQVVRQREERALLAEARRRGEQAGRAPHSRLALARWMLAEGLAEEALGELERVLAEAPDEPEALALLRSEAFAGVGPAHAQARVDPASALESLLVAGAQGGPARRELAIARLAAWLPRAELERVAALELRRPQPARRAFAAALARRALPGTLLPQLGALAVADAFVDVRGAATGALRSALEGDASASGGEALAPVAHALEAPWASVRANAVDALGALGHPAAVAPLVAHLARLQSASGAPSGVRGNFSLTGQIALVTDYDVEIAQAASIGDPIVGVQSFGVVHDVRAQAQITREVELRSTLLTLQRLTGLPERSPEAWQAWWQAQGDAWTQHALERRHAPDTLRAAQQD